MSWSGFLYIIPEAFLISSSLILLLLGIKFDKTLIHISSMVTIFITILLLIYRFYINEVIIFNSLLKSSLYIWLSKLIILSLSEVILLMFLLSKQEYCYEFSIMILFAVFGFITLIGANNLLSFYLSFEIQSISLYALTCFNKHLPRSSESGIKYFILGALASCIMLYGISLIYGYSNSIDFNELSKYFFENKSIPIGVILGVIFILISFCFKLSVAPFHMWTPDVYQGSPTIVTAFFSIIPKATFILLLIRVLSEVFSGHIMYWQQILICVSVISICVSSLGAIKQNNLKRLFAYAAIGHVGYMLVAISIFTNSSIIASISYLILYAVMNIGLFAMLLQYKDDDCDILNITNLCSRNPLTALCITIIILSMAGIPPLGGFFIKYDILLSLIENNFIKLAVLFALMSVVACYYYLRIIRVIYFDSCNSLYKHNLQNNGLVIILFISAAANLFFYTYMNYIKGFLGYLFDFYFFK
ncbi:NADH-quinone oxidoreductase subunit N [Neoehrlichia mikurensis]|uniref:NADH-quinone oxidoreductase subunit N n=1 Tax=Neoehrlichia mikurensis TaxID=89586 RepID=A0A9Q9F3V4_9RICK|nr:NADH-quinone oxidoreductase subunit N [Neoehrlichia mikurensis]QXK91997.1 NADH-quinone oxidoreductase subunit N [Neoehrlichia mikurensis]QXK92454.1 NADH-quinone oxidoreductase subunit N [Neoehrlichia mikurensis]QXK93690.1 NADH-quinone oxidoreductase subunit N [Neoehrlichia mikurensis]UTO55338.1 NADH-quinone oxidoreductase subunit N [Neoehrlichia mikurensis]UTO56259.1 NADH-quinone oxidoreductase subunit N [Neoehrlichia mikurensis]